MTGARRYPTTDTAATAENAAATAIQAIMRGRRTRIDLTVRRLFNEANTALLFNLKRDMQELRMYPT